MSQFQARITSVATNGPYAYILLKDGAGLIDRNAQANISTALDNVKNDIAANLAGQTVNNVVMTVNAS